MERVTTQQAVSLAQERGFPGHLLFAIFTEPVAGWEPVWKNLDAHLAHQLELERTGVMYGAGPLCTDDGLYCDGAGMIIVRAESFEEARRIAERDPMHSSGARRFRIHPWIVNEGSMTLTVRMSDLKGRFE